MEIRKLLDKWPKTTATVASLATVASIGLLVRNWSASKSDLPKFPDKAYFTDDDGATWFADSDSNVAPYQDSNGRTAVRANVFTCDGGKHNWVQYLEKYTDQAKASAEALQAGRSLAPNAPGPLAGKLVKRPGGGNWVGVSNPAAGNIMTAKCPDGLSGTPQPVMP